MSLSCPAAHSMDTTWFAVDLDGFVGTFTTGEDGALPEKATATAEGGDFDDWPLVAVVVAGAIVDGYYPGDDEVSVVSDYAQSGLVVLDAEADLQAFSTSHGSKDAWFVAHEGPPRILASFGERSPEDWKSIVADPAVSRVLFWDTTWEWFDENPSHVYRYANDEYGDPGRYERRGQPQAPIRSSSLAPELAAAVGKLRLPVRFSEHPSLHLADFISEADCHMWSNGPLRGDPQGEADPAEDSERNDQADNSERKQRGSSARSIVVGGLALLAVIAWWLLR